MGELEAIRERLAAVVSWENMAKGPESRVLPIRFDDATWLLDEVERLREGLRAILREHAPFNEHGKELCRMCSYYDGGWPCVTVLEARAALEGKG